MNAQITALLEDGRASLGIELGSTRIKACLIGPDAEVLATGSHEWENVYADKLWTYSLDAVWSGLQSAYAALIADVQQRFGVAPERYAAMGVSAMMHGYLAFDADGELLAPFRTWRNTNTGVAAAELTELLGVNIPLRWSIAHLHQAVVDAEPHVPEIRFLTTLAGYVHGKLTGEKVLGVGDASGMFPIDSATRDYDAELVARYDALAAGRVPALNDLLPRVLVAGTAAGALTDEGATLLDPSGTLRPGIPFAPPRATRAPAWSRPAPWLPAPETSAPARASSRWSCSNARSPRCTTSSISSRRPRVMRSRWCTATTVRASWPRGRTCSPRSPPPPAPR